MYRKGFSLIEILVALVIFALGSVSIWSLFAAILSNHQRAIDQQQATLLAQSLIAELQDVELRKDRPLHPISEQPSQTFPDYFYNISYQPLPPSAVLVKINIYYYRQGAKQQHDFHTVLLRTLPPEK